MEKQKSKQASLLIWALVAGMLSQNLLVPVLSSAATVEDQKNYYSPDPHAGTPATGSTESPPHVTPPSHGSGGSYGSTPPTYGTPSHGSTPPSHRTPSHGSGGRHRSAPPSNCGNPPSRHHDPTPAPPTGSGGGGYYNSPPPSPPTPSYSGSPPSITPSTPSTPTIIIPPTTPTTPSTPTITTPPSSPFIDPGTPTVPGISIPSPPFDPSSPPLGGTCSYWRTHPGVIWGLFGWWGTTLGGAFGVSSVPGSGANLNLHEALSNTRGDGLGALYREGTASLLNSMVNKGFPYSTKEVRDNFVAALGSDKAAASQARIFKQANEGLKPRA